MIDAVRATASEETGSLAQGPADRQSAYTFAEMIAPMSLDQFLSEVFQKRPAVFRNPGGRDFTPVFPLEAVDQLLAGAALRGSDVMLVRDGVYPQRTAYCTTDTWADASYNYSTVVDAARVYEHYNQGHTIILHAIHRSWLPLARFCRELEGALNCSVSGAALLSPPNLDPESKHQGPRVHYDVNDHLIVQVSGTKLWRFYDMPFPLPMRNQLKYMPKADGAVCSMELTLYPGDTLYFPGGYRHDAIATDQHSLHLPISLVAYRWHDALSRALEALELDPRFRSSIPPQMLTEEGFPAFSEELQRVARLALEQLSAGGVFQSLRTSLMQERRPLLDGYLTDLVQLERIGLETTVRRRPGVFSEVRQTDGGAALELGRQELRERELDAAGWAFMQAAPSFRVAETPSQTDGAGKVALVKRLLRAGYLELA